MMYLISALSTFAGSDYSGQLSSVFNFVPSSVVPQRVCVPDLIIFDDNFLEPDETIVLSITQPAQFASSSTVIIFDNDGKSAVMMINFCDAFSHFQFQTSHFIPIIQWTVCNNG